MKNLNMIKLSVIVSIFCLISCKKETINPLNTDVNQHPVKRSLYEMPIIPNPLPIEDYFVNDDDRNDERISRNLYTIALTAKPLFMDTRYNEYIIEHAKLNDNNCVDLREFTSSSDLRDLATDARVFDALGNLVNMIDLSHPSQNPDRLNTIEQYIPAIFVANIDHADYNQTPIFSSGTYVNNELRGAESYTDYIVAWYINEKNETVEIILNEEMANSTTHPIFIIDNAELDITRRPRRTTTFVRDEDAHKDMENAWYSMYEYQINHRYDNTNHSEFCITGFQINENGGVQFIFFNGNNGNILEWKQIADIHKNDIGHLFSVWNSFCQNNVTPFNQNFIFWNTYERDWARSNKDLGHASRNGADIYMYGRRKYSGDWYGYDPNVVNNNPVNLESIYNSWANWYENSKGKLRIWKIQP